MGRSALTQQEALVPRCAPQLTFALPPDEPLTIPALRPPPRQLLWQQTLCASCELDSVLEQASPILGENA